MHRQGIKSALFLSIACSLYHVPHFLINLPRSCQYVMQQMEFALFTMDTTWTLQIHLDLKHFIFL